jgi:hypothetical protein
MWHIIWNLVAVCSLILNALMFFAVILHRGTEADEQTKYLMFRQEIELWAYKHVDDHSRSYRAFQELLAKYDKIDSEG